MEKGNEIKRILLADDSLVMRRILEYVISQDPTLEVVGTLPNGKSLLEAVKLEVPDLVILDVEMPVMGGLETLKILSKKHPTLPVVMFSTHTRRGAKTTVDSLFLGARDYATKPFDTKSLEESKEHIRSELIGKIKKILKTESPAPSAPRPSAGSLQADFEVVAIGASTGGPQVLNRLLTELPAHFPLPLVIVQHMPPLFTKYFAQRLNRKGEIEVCEATSGEVLKPGKAWIAPGDHHLEIRRKGDQLVTYLHQQDPVNSCRPAADVLFDSLAKKEITTLAVILTGMGQDGLKGCENLHKQGGVILVQDAESSVVWGMPGAVFKAGLAHGVFPVDKMGREILRLARPLSQS